MHRKHKPKLGQNFLADDAACHAIANALGDLSARTVVEIGPGRGAITDLLASGTKRLIALELDEALAADLRERYLTQAHVRVVTVDVLRADLRDLIAPEQTCDVVGNLPYYITSEILFQLFAAAADGILERAVVMMQREVAERVAAIPGVREFGALSVAAQMHGRAEMLFTLPPAAFSPPPAVDSTVLRFTFAPRFHELGVDAKGFLSFVRLCFAQKRKTLGNNLRHAGYAPGAISAAWPAGLEPLARSEQLTLEEFASLYRGLRN